MLENKKLKIILLALGLLPLILFILAFAITLAGGMIKEGGFLVIYILIIVTFPGALICYVINVFRNKSVKKDQRYLWAALLFLGNMLVYPFYWYFHIWR